ncbi:MAG: outer membrane protein assembly factor BamE [Gammaproteobacteria bacterium]|nr:MAG: outer membrane protein assembly factor BamE [Gammaproteobacteria bacterium]
MRKLLISIALAASLLTSGCSSIGEGAKKLGGITEIIPQALDRAPFIYRPTIEQGNLITQEQVNRLEPGMSREQVRFVLGTPTLQDFFHAKRWDYPYTVGKGSHPGEIKHLAVFFENDRLTRIVGDYRPQPAAEQEPARKPGVVKVPDWNPKAKTLVGKALQAVGLEDEEE